MAAATPGHGGDPSVGALRTGLEGEGESWCVGTGGGGLRRSEGGGDSGGGAEDLRPRFGPLSPEIGAAAPSKTSMEWPRPCSTVDLDDDIWELNKYECDFYPVVVDCSETIYNGTQQSCILDKGKGIVSGHTIPVEVLDSDEDGCMFDVGDYGNAGHSTAVAEEQELINKLKRQRNEGEDPEGIIILDKLTQMKKQRQNPDLHIEGDTDVEEFYSEEEESDAEEVAEQDFISSKKLVVRQGPTSRSHHEVEEPEGYNFVPSADELSSPDDLGSSDDDGFVRPFVLPSGNKRKVKKTKKRNWYDPDMAYPEEQFAIKLCFKDVYEFRVALRNYHIAQLRNYQFHRNSPKRVIVKCTEKGCPFYITASSVGKEKTFCLRKTVRP